MLILRGAYAEVPGREGDPNHARPQQMVREHHLQHRSPLAKDGLLTGFPLPPAAGTSPTGKRDHDLTVPSQSWGNGGAVQARSGSRRPAAQVQSPGPLRPESWGSSAGYR